MRVSVVVPARDAARTLPATLDGLAAQELDGPFEVIVVDNGSGDGTPEIAEAHPIVDRVLRRRRGEGPGAARNDGARAASGPVIAFTDADCAPTRGWLRAGLEAIADADIVQGRVTPPDGATVGPFDHTLWVTFEYGLYETANLFVRASWLERVGGFEDWINADRSNGAQPRRPFGEDVLFAWRARRAGARTAFSDGALVHHAVFPGTAREHLEERSRDGNFAELARHVPELREIFHFRRFFLSRRSAAFDLALAGVMAAALRRSPLPLAAALPWARLVRQESIRRTGVPSKRVAAAVAAGDCVAFVSLVRGSVRARSVLL